MNTYENKSNSEKFYFKSLKNCTKIQMINHFILKSMTVHFRSNKPKQNF